MPLIFSFSEFPANIYTLITHALNQASNTDTLPTYGLFSKLLFFPITYQYHVHRLLPCMSPIFPHIWYLNTKLVFKTITKFIPLNYCARKISTAPVRFLFSFFVGHQLRFIQVTHPSRFYCNKKEFVWMFSSKKFVLLITSPQALISQVHIG